MEDFERLYNKALRFLAYRPRSEREIRDYLTNKFSKKKSSALRHSGEEERRLQNLLTTERNVRDSGHGQNDEREYIVERVISKLKEQKFINDEEFAKWWIESRLRFKPRSINLIKRELLQKGVDREIIDGQISNLPAKQDLASRDKFLISNDLEQARKLIEKRIGRVQNLSKQEIYQKLGSYLARRGFDWDTIKQVIDELLFKEYTTNN